MIRVDSRAAARWTVELAGRRCLVTGGLGFIGSNLTARLTRAGAHVVVVDSLVPSHGGRRENLPSDSDVEVIVADIGDRDAVADSAREAEIIFNLAGQVSHVDSMVDPVFDLEVNTRSHLAFLETLRAVESRARVVYTSTRQVFGHPQYLPVDEEHPVMPVDVNGVSQHAAEHLHRLYGEFYDLESCVLRLTNVYGPRQRLTGDSQGFIPIFVRQALLDEEITVYADGRQLRDCLYVDDVVDILLLAGISPDAPAQLFNVGTDEVHSVRVIADLIVSTAGSGRVASIPWPKHRETIAVGSYYTDWSKAKRTLGWMPKVGLREGIRRMIEYYRTFPTAIA
jgi:UDP-glucose 4-epimerase